MVVPYATEKPRTACIAQAVLGFCRSLLRLSHMAPALLRRDAIDLSEGLDVVGYIVVAHMGGNIADLEDSFFQKLAGFFQPIFNQIF